MSPRLARCTIYAALLVAAPPLLAAQNPAPPADSADEHAAGDSAAAPARKKGLFGRLKDVANDKTVKTVTKAATCSGMVPGASQVAQATGKCAPGSVLNSGSDRQAGGPTRLYPVDTPAKRTMQQAQIAAQGRGVSSDDIGRVIKKHSNGTYRLEVMSEDDARRAMDELNALQGDATKANSTAAQAARRAESFASPENAESMMRAMSTLSQQASQLTAAASAGMGNSMGLEQLEMPEDAMGDLRAGKATIRNFPLPETRDGQLAFSHAVMQDGRIAALGGMMQTLGGEWRVEGFVPKAKGGKDGGKGLAQAVHDALEQAVGGGVRLASPKGNEASEARVEIVRVKP